MSATKITGIQLFKALETRLGDNAIGELPNIATKDFVEAKISESKFQIILWAFVFWATQLGAMFAFVKLVK